MKKRTLAVLIAVIMVVACAVGGTLAWLKSQTQEVVNTFTAGDINITLAETTSNYKMVPGNDIAKDPKVTVKAGSEACWLFVKVDKSENSTNPDKKAFDDYLTYTIAAGWTPLTDADNDGAADDGVYYREVGATSSDTAFDVLLDNKVTVNDTVTKTMLNALDGSNNPTLTFTAYAVQKDNINNVADAWNEALGLVR